MNIRGKVKSVKETDFEPIDKIGQIEKGKEYWTEYYVFDNNRNKIEESKYYHGELREKKVYLYNEHKYLKQERKVFGSPANSLDKNVRELNEVLTYSYNFDSHGKPVIRLVTPGSAETMKMLFADDSTVFVYDPEERLVELRSYRRKHNYYGNGKEAFVRDVSVHKYNEEGKTQIWFTGTEVYEDTSEPVNREIQVIGFNKPKLGDLIRFDTVSGTRYHYNRDQLHTKIVDFGVNHELKTVINLYETQVDYNEFGDPVSEATSKIVPAKGTLSGLDSREVISYSYKYDDHKNWVTKTIYINGIVSKFSERKYEYF